MMNKHKIYYNQYKIEQKVQIDNIESRYQKKRIFYSWIADNF